MLDRLISFFGRPPATAEGWLARLGRWPVSPRDLTSFEAWLEADPRHLADYEGLKRLNEDLSELKLEFSADRQALRPPARRALAVRWTIPAMGALAAVALAVVVWPQVADPMRGATSYATAVGEVRDVALADGTKITLDTGSALRAKVDDGVRRVVLDHGAAYFAVAHDGSRPFRVAVGERQVMVTGTRFTTALQDGEARIALLEGQVRVTEVRGDAVALVLTPGQQVSYRAAGALRREARVDPLRTAIWRERRLVFEDAPLSEVLGELARYTSVRMTLSDPALGRRRVTAIVPLDDPQPMTARIDRMFPVSITPAGPGRVEVRAD